MVLWRPSGWITSNIGHIASTTFYTQCVCLSRFSITSPNTCGSQFLPSKWGSTRRNDSCRYCSKRRSFYASCPISTPNSDKLWMHLLFDIHICVLRTPKKREYAPSHRMILLEKSAPTCWYSVILSTKYLRCIWLLGFSYYFHRIL